MRGTVKGLAQAGQASAGESLQYYSKSSSDERRIIQASFFMGILSGVTWYVIALYWDALGFTSEEIGLIGGIGSAVGIVSLLFTGFLADIFGRKNLLLIGLLFSTFGAALFLLTPNLVLFIIAEGLISLGTSMIQPSTVALMAGKAAPTRLKFFYGLQGFSNQIAITIASATGIFFPGFFLDEFGLELTSGYWLVILAAVLCNVLPIFYVLKVSDVKRSGERLRLSFDRTASMRLFMYSFQNVLIGIGAGFVIPWLPLVFQEGMGATSLQLTLMVTASNIAVAIGWFIIPKFAEARGSVALITAFQIASVVFLLAIPYSAFSLLLVAALFTARGLLMLIPTPVLNAYVMNIVSEEIRASFWAISSLAWTVGYSAAFAASGYVWANDYSSVVPFYITSAAYIAGSLVFYLYFKRVVEPGDGPTKTA
ncbi:MAG: MFS transporter [Thermoplasmata archaeon]